jgi:mono/diheme cytochrome c family protein
MNLARLNLVLAVCLVCLLLASLWRRDAARLNAEFLPDMKYTPAYRAYSPNGRLPGGTSWQAPVVGTAFLGIERLQYQPTADEALRAGEELVNPVPDAAELRLQSIERGKKVFQTFCTPCHGAAGASAGPVAQRGYPPPPSLLTGKSTKVKDGQLFHIVSLGQNTMPGFAAQISPLRRWDLVNFIRSLQVAQPAPEAPMVEPPAEEKPAPAGPMGEPAPPANPGNEPARQPIAPAQQPKPDE